MEENLAEHWEKPLFKLPRPEKALKECSTLGEKGGIFIELSKERSVEEVQLLWGLGAENGSSGGEELLFWTSHRWLGNSGFIKRKREGELWS